MRFRKYLCLVAFLLVVISCKKTKSSSEVEQQPEITFGPSTVQIDNPTSQVIDTVTDQTVVFTGNTTQLGNLKVGDIIVSGIASKAPAGFLRKIASIEKTGNTVKVNTVFVSLVQAFVNLNIDKTIPLPEVALNLNDLILFDDDGNTSTTFDQLRLNTGIKLNADLRVKININKGKLDYALIGGVFKKDITKSVVFGGSVLGFNKDIRVYEQVLGAVVIPGTPIVIIPTITISIGANGSVSIEMSYSETEKGSGGNYMEFKNGNWNPLSEKSYTQTSDFSGSFGSINMKAYIKPALNFKFWGLDAAKVSAYAEGYTSLTAQLAPYQPCEFKAGIKGGIEASLNLFDIIYLSAGYPSLFDESKVLYTCASTPPLIADFKADKRTITAGESVNFTDQSLGSPTAWSWSFPGATPGTSTNQSPSNIRYNTAGTFNVSLTVSKGAENKTVIKNAFIIVNPSLVQLPTISTSSVTSVTSNSASSGGNISNDGGAQITARGVCWSTGQNPTIANSKTSDGTGTGSFTSSITSLNANTTYYIRAYATNSAGTAYGNQASFTTNASAVFETVTIGTQVWMLKNLDITTYRNGDPIPQVTDPTEWTNLTSGAWCYFQNDPLNNSTFGKLYNWYALVDPRGLSPLGWHIPSDYEWTVVENFLGGSNIAGGKMKSTGTIEAGTGLWFSPNAGATNSSGFTGLPGVARNGNGTFGTHGATGFWWSSTEHLGIHAWYRTLEHVNVSINGNYAPKQAGFSVRCIKD